MAIGEDTVLAKHVVIATGARRATLNIPGEEHVTTSDKFLELDKLPSLIGESGNSNDSEVSKK